MAGPTSRRRGATPGGAPLRLLLLESAPEGDLLKQVLAESRPRSALVVATSVASARDALRTELLAAVLITWPLPASVAALEDAPAWLPRILVVEQLSSEALRGAQKLAAVLCLRDPVQLSTVLECAAANAARQLDREFGHALSAHQRDVLESIAAGEPLPQILERLVHMTESWSDGLCSILLLDRGRQSVHHGAAPSLPPAYVRAIDGCPIGPRAGSCGTAAFLGQPVHVRDIATHPYWEDYRDIALPLGLRACWSTPILSSDHTILGTFAVYYTEPRDAAPDEIRLVATAAYLAAIAISRDHNLRALRLSEARYRQLLETSHEGVLTLDRSGVVTYANARVGTMFGGTPDALVGRSYHELVHPSEQQQVEGALDHRRAGTSEQYELRMRRLDGSDLWAIVAASPVLGDRGEINGMLKMLTDITERRRADEALQRSEYELRSIFESTVIGVTLIDAQTYPVRFNSALCDILGYTQDELRRTRLISLVVPEDMPIVLERSRALEVCEPARASIDVRLRRKDGQALWVRVHSSRIPRNDPEQPHAVVIIEDITASRRLEEAVLAEERLLAAIYETVTDIITYFKVEPDECYRLLSANPAFCQAYGVQQSEIIGKRLEEIVTNASMDSVKRHYRLAIEERRSVFWEELSQFTHGVEYAEAVASPVFDAAGTCTNLVVVSRTITARRRAEAKIAEQAALLDRTRDAIVLTGVNRIVRFWNASAVRMYEYSRDDAVGTSIQSLVCADRRTFEEVEAQLLAEGAFIGELVQHTRSGREIIVESSLTLLYDAQGKPDAVLGIYTDVTEKKKLEEQVMFAQRMEGLGTLAGGIAHDFNNILAAIRGYLELALHGMPPNGRSRDYLEVVRTATDRAVDLVQQILTFSRRKPSRRVACRLSPVIDEVLRLLRATLPRMITIEASYAEGELEVMADASQIHQIIMNLGTNAAQALSSRGTIEVRLEPVVLQERLIGVASEIGPGTYMRLMVADDGIGMDAVTQRRIFDPFFTTKAPGLGTGLGLAVVLGIVRDHGGALRVSSAPGRGTTFEVYLAEATMQRQTSRPPRLREVRSGRGERILCVDDEISLVTLERVFLEDLDYRVDAFDNPVDALRAFIARPYDYAAIVTDFAMSEMSGIELAEAALAVRSSVPLIMVSGYLRLDQRAEAQRAGASAILSKPDYLDELAHELHRLLAPARPSEREAG